MIQQQDHPWYGPFGELNFQEECEFCGRSIIGRFGGSVGMECDSCNDEFSLLNRAGKLEWG